MAFDGIVISNIVKDMKEKLTGGRIYKIYQPEDDELNLVIKNGRETYRLMLSANASLPLIYLIPFSKENPMTAPGFCMLLRKHIGNGRITDIAQPGFERIVELNIEHLDEMGDLCQKKLIIEIMGKHSNIIFMDENGTILDSIKHISHMVSSVREVLPGRKYASPPSGGKISPFDLTREYFDKTIMTKPVNLTKAIYTSITGFSPVTANELLYRAGLDGGINAEGLAAEEKDRLYQVIISCIDDISHGRYTPQIVFDKNEPVEFSSIELTMYTDLNVEDREDISVLLDEYYYRKALVTRMRQKSADLRHIVNTAYERALRKYDLQRKQLDDTCDREKYRIYGELINTYGYTVKQGSRSFVALNYYDDKEIEIPLDPLIPVMSNAAVYFEKYNKKKRTFDALSKLITETEDELDYLKSVQTFLDMAVDEASLLQVREELSCGGYIRKKQTGGRKGAGKQAMAKPYHYISSDGFHIYAGKNNIQNDELSFKSADADDLWFHAKKMPGSHVIVRLNGAKDVPDDTYNEAARIAAYYSAGRDNPKVEIDYTRRKNLKKPAGAKPGYVIYHTNFSMVASTDITGIAAIDF